MNNKANYKKGNRIKIIKALYASGCIPYRSLRILQGEVKLTQRTVRKMEREGLLVVYRSKNGNGKMVRLKKDWTETIKDYYDYLPYEYIERYKKISEELSKSKKSRGREERLLKNAEVSLLMNESGVGTYPDEKESIDKYYTMLGQGRSQYYDSVEVKKYGSYRDKVEMDKDGTKKVSSSRINGLLISPGGTYAVYNITNHLIEWERYGELKIVHHIERILVLAGNNKKDIKREKKIIDCLLVANEMEVYERVLTNENKKRRSTTLLNIDYAYENMYAIPSDKNGIEMLKLMQKENWKLRMKGLLLNSNNSDTNTENFSIVHDGYNEEDGYILLFCTGNLSKLKMFLKRATNARDSEKFCIYCFTYQLPLFQRLQTELGGISIKAMELTEYIELERSVE